MRSTGRRCSAAALGDEVVNHYLAMKRHEIGRFLSHVTDWEHREYFEAF